MLMPYLPKGKPMDYTKPVYRIDGHEFKTVSGLCRYLEKKHHANAVSGVGKNRTLSVYNDRKAIATYSVSDPEVGKPMTLTEFK